MDAMSAALLLQNATKTLYCGPLWRSIGNCGGTGAASNVGVLRLALWATLWRGIAAQSNGVFLSGDSLLTAETATQGGLTDRK